MNEGQFLELEGNIQQTYDRYFKSRTDFLPMLCNVETSKKAIENHFGVGAFGQMKEWTGVVSYDDFVKGYLNTYRHKKYSTGVQIDQDMWEDEEYSAIKSRVNGAAYGVYKTLQAWAAKPYNEAVLATAVGPDSQPLGSNAHHNVPGDDAQSNLFTLDMTYQNLETILNAMRNFKDDRGDIMDIQGDTIICGLHWAKTVKQLVGSEKEAYTSDNQKNVYTDLSYIVNPRITGKKWFVVNSDLMKGGNGLNFFMRKDPRKLQRDGKPDFDAEILKWKSVGRWSQGWDNWYFASVVNPA
jgi:hypothetical protein